MCSWGFTGGMPWMWMGSSIGLIGLVVLFAVGAYLLGKRAQHRN